MAEVISTRSALKPSFKGDLEGPCPRQHWVDAVKGIAIMAVVLLHSDYNFYHSEWLPLWSLLGNSWHVGVFFMVSGFFIRANEGFATCLAKNCKSLYLKLVIIYLAAIALHNQFIDWGLYQSGQEYGGKIMEYYSLPQILKQGILAIVGAGREPILSPLWFVYVLFAARIALNATFHLTDRIFRKTKHKELLRGLLILMLCIGGHVLSNVAEIQIPRYGNLFSAMWLMYLGYCLNRVRKVQFNSGWWALAGGAAYYLCTIACGPNVLMTNTYHNVLSLTLCTTGALYALCFAAKWCERKAPAAVSLIAAVGERSFWIMALHLLAFKVATLALTALGMSYPLDVLNSPATPHLWVLITYTATGVLIPWGLAKLLPKQWQ